MARRLDGEALNVEVEIAAIGARGDGVARLGGRPIYVPLAAPGDRLRIRLGAPRGDGVEAEIVERLADGPARVPAPCPYFGDCGGCQVQHLEAEAYRAWKRGLVVEAFAHHGLTPEIATLVEFVPAARRRAKLVAERREGLLLLGFNARRSRRVVDIAGCLVLTPALARRLPALRAALPDLLGEGARLELQLLAVGEAVELVLGGGGRLDGPRRDILRGLAASADLVRIAWRATAESDAAIVFERAAFVANFDGVAVELPSGAFLQASEAAEQAMRALVAKATRRAKSVADLFAGCGSLGAPLARRAAVFAAESDAAACRALEAAARARPDIRLLVERRDLDRRPLLPAELAVFDAVIFDPPRGGAAPQAKQLARAAVPTVVAVSCNPATLARDARLLVDGGYVLKSVQPIDQFRWSAHVEAVAVFHRPRRGV